MKITSQKEIQFGKWAMWACCAVMLLPLAGYLIVAQSSVTTAGLFNAVIPLGLCLGMHVAMHKMMGKSCHGKTAEIPATEQKDAI